MSVDIEGDRIVLAGRCRVEDAEALLGALQAHQRSAIDLSACTGLHGAVFQVLCAARRALAAAPADPALQRWLVPALAADGGTFLLQDVRI